jgi:hypothetical protein
MAVLSRARWKLAAHRLELSAHDGSLLRAHLNLSSDREKIDARLFEDPHDRWKLTSQRLKLPRTGWSCLEPDESLPRTDWSCRVPDGSLPCTRLMIASRPMKACRALVRVCRATEGRMPRARS